MYYYLIEEWGQFLRTLHFNLHKMLCSMNCYTLIKIIDCHLKSGWDPFNMGLIMQLAKLNQVLLADVNLIFISVSHSWTIIFNINECVMSIACSTNLSYLYRWKVWIVTISLCWVFQNSYMLKVWSLEWNRRIC